MKQRKSIAIIGTGAVGGYYGGLLQRAGFDLHFLTNSDYDQIRLQGLLVESPHGDFHHPHVNAYNDPEQMPHCDIVVVALKTTANHLLPSILPHVLGRDGFVLTLQNGLGTEQEIAGIVGPERVIGGLCFLCSNKIGPGHIRHLDYGLITIGEYRQNETAGGITPRLVETAALMQSAGISVKPLEDLPLARWKKLVWNIPFNGMSVVENRLTDELLQNPATRARCEILMREVASASVACARPIGEDFIRKMISDTENMIPYAPSMKLDYDRGRPMEIESIYANPLRAARAAGVGMPETEKLFRQLGTLSSASRS